MKYFFCHISFGRKKKEEATESEKEKALEGD